VSQLGHAGYLGAERYHSHLVRAGLQAKRILPSSETAPAVEIR
jgi:hypothetical protein